MSRRAILRLSAGGLICVALAISGCEEPTHRREITGKVTLKQQPLKEGVIEFVPLGGGAEGSPATKEAGIINNGEYTIPADAGLAPGRYKVLITSGDSSAAANPDEPPGPSGNFVMKDRIPPEFNSKSKVEVEVTDKGPNQFDFAIP